MTFVSASAPCTQAAGTVTCSVATAPAGFDQTYDVTVAVDPNTTVSPLSNTATVSTTTSDPNAGNDSSTSTATPDPLADVSVTKVANPAAILKNAIDDVHDHRPQRRAVGRPQRDADRHDAGRSDAGLGDRARMYHGR